LITAGIDIGSATSKAVIMNNEQIIAHALIKTGADSTISANSVMNEVLNEAGLSLTEIGSIIATGYGRVIVPFATDTVTELSCHAKGANWEFSSARTVLDIGGQDCKAIRCDENGRLINFVMNDKCAAGTGRFLEVMADVMDLTLDQLGGLSLLTSHEINITNTCTVFARSEVSNLLRQGVEKENLLAGLHTALSNRIYMLLRRVGIEKDVVITGGIAKNIGIVHKLQEKLAMQLCIPNNPQIMGALGAALLAKERPART